MYTSLFLNENLPGRANGRRLMGRSEMEGFRIHRLIKFLRLIELWPVAMPPIKEEQPYSTRNIA